MADVGCRLVQLEVYLNDGNQRSMKLSLTASVDTPDRELSYLPTKLSVFAPQGVLKEGNHNPWPC